MHTSSLRKFSECAARFLIRPGTNDNKIALLSLFSLLKSGKKCLDPNLKNEITRSILKINKLILIGEKSGH